MENKNALVFIPEDNIAVSFEVTNDKPFNKCFKCRSFRNGCSGPNLIAMGIKRACEFLQLTRIFLGYSYQFVAESTGVSLATVKRILTGKIEDPSYFTFKSLSDFLVGDPNGKFPCANPDIAQDPENAQRLNDALRDLERAVADNKDYKTALDNIHGSYNAELRIVRNEAQSKIDYLLTQVDRLRKDVDAWHLENERKAKTIDKLLER